VVRGVRGVELLLTVGEAFRIPEIKFLRIGSSGKHEVCMMQQIDALPTPQLRGATDTFLVKVHYHFGRRSRGTRYDHLPYAYMRLPAD
jgi:hypothetical protein